MSSAENVVPALPERMESDYHVSRFYVEALEAHYRTLRETLENAVHFGYERDVAVQALTATPEAP